MDQQQQHQHEDRFIQGNSNITTGTQDIIRSHGNNKKVSRYGQSISRFRGGHGGGATNRKMTGGGESRDDGDQQHSRQLEEQNSILVDHSSASFVGTNYSQSECDTLSQSDYSVAQENSRGLHQGHSSSSSLATVQLEWLLQQQLQLTERLQDLETQFESLQKQKAYDKSMFAMKRGQLLVEIEGLQEDNVFLTKKRDKLGRKLLALHLKRVERMESDEQIKEERDGRGVQRSESQTSF